MFRRDGCNQGAFWELSPDRSGGRKTIPSKSNTGIQGVRPGFPYAATDDAGVCVTSRVNWGQAGYQGDLALGLDPCNLGNLLFSS